MRYCCYYKERYLFLLFISFANATHFPQVKKYRKGIRKDLDFLEPGSKKKVQPQRQNIQSRKYVFPTKMLCHILCFNMS